jgi:cytochrome P450
MSQYDFDAVLGEIVEAGADTTAGSLLTIVLALAKYPQVQKRAREEIDRVCGTDRGPSWSDFEKLPYVNAIVKEALRWRPV